MNGKLFSIIGLICGMDLIVIACRSINEHMQYVLCIKLLQFYWLNTAHSKLHSYSFNPDICSQIHLAECTVRLLNRASRNNYPYNPKLVGNTVNRTRDLWLDNCIQDTLSSRARLA